MNAAAPRNDAQSGRFPIYDACYIVGDNSEATHETNELDHAAAGGSKSLWWAWSPSGSGTTILTLRSYGNNSQFVLAVYRHEVDGEVVEVGQINPLTDLDQNFTTQFEAQSGELYSFVVDSPFGAEGGRFYLGLNQAPEFLTPLQVRVSTSGNFEIPVNIAGAPSEVELNGGPESVSYDPVSQVLRGYLPTLNPETMFLRATNAFGETVTELVVVPDEEELIYTGAASAVGFVGVPFEYVLSFAGNPDLSELSVELYGALPDGLGLVYDADQIKIKGIPTRAGDQSMEIRLSSSNLRLSGLILRIPVRIIELSDSELQPELTSPLMARGVVGEPFSYQIEASLPVVDRFYDSQLPTGLTFNQETGLISGIPENSGDWTVQLTAEFDYSPNSTKAELLLVIDEASEFAPVIQSAPTAVAWVGVPFEYQIEATNGAEHYSDYSGLPQGLTLNEETGLISGTPEWAQGGEELRIVAHNQRGSAEFVVTLDILEPDHIAHVTSPAQVSATVGEFFEYQIDSNLEMFEPNQMSAQLPEGFEYDEVNSRLFGVPQSVGDETAEIQFLNNEIAVQIRVLEDETPVEFLNAASAVGRVGSFFYFAMNAPGAIGFDMYTAIPGLAFDDNAGVFTGLPTSAGIYEIEVHASASHGPQTYTNLKIVILEATEVVPPVIILSPGQLVAEVGETFAYSIASSEFENSSFDVLNLPTGIFFDQASGTIFGSVDQAYEAEVEVSAGLASADLHLHFYDSVERPLLVTSAPSAVGRTGELFEYQIETNAADIGAQDLYFYTGANFPESLSLDDSTGLISGYLEEDLPVDFEVHVDVSGDFSELKLTIVDGGTGVPAQVVSPAHLVAYPNEPFEYQFVFDLSDVTFDVVQLDEGVFYDPATQTLSGVLPNEGQTEVYFERYDESSGRWFWGQLSFEIRDLQDRPGPLMISALAPVANRGELFSYTVEFDREGVTWSLWDAPNWLTRSGNQLVGYVPENQGGGNEEVRLDVTDSYSYGRDVTLMLNYNSPKIPPVVVSSAYAPATVGVEFSYQLEVEGDYDDIEVVRLPEWASYDPVSMRITGTPLDYFGTEQWVFRVYSNEFPSFSAMIQSAVDFGSDQVPVFTSLAPPPVFEGIPYQYQIEVDGWFYDLNYNGPEWLTVDAETLLLTGMPEDSSGGYVDLYVESNAGSANAFVELQGREQVAPYLLEELQGLVIYPGGKVFFKPQLAHSSLNYEWFKDGVSLGLHGDWLEIDGVSVDDQGDYSVRFANEYGGAWTLPVTLQVGQSTVYRHWLIAHFGREVDEPSFSESGLSFAGDSTSDLMKWAFGIDPTSVVTKSLAESSMEPAGFQIQFQRSTAPRDVRIIVERSVTLGANDWTGIAVLPPEGAWQAQQPNVTVDEVGTGELRTVSVVDSGEFAQSFMRVRVELVSAAE